MARPIHLFVRHVLAVGVVAGLTYTAASTPAEAGCRKRVYLYDAHWCGTCRQVKAILSRNQVRYTRLDATTARVQADMIRRFGSTAVPRLLIGNSLVSSPDEARIRRLCR